MIEALAEFIEAVVERHQSPTVSDEYMTQVRYIMQVDDEASFKSNISVQTLISIESKEMDVILEELISAIGLQRFRFVQRQNNGKLVSATMGRLFAECIHRFESHAVTFHFFYCKFRRPQCMSEPYPNRGFGLHGSHQSTFRRKTTRSVGTWPCPVATRGGRPSFGQYWWDLYGGLIDLDSSRAWSLPSTLTDASTKSHHATSFCQWCSLSSSIRYLWGRL